MARAHRLDNQDFAQSLAELYVAGKSYDEIRELTGVAPSTMREYVKDPRLQAHARRLSAERSMRISRRIDGEIEGRLAHMHEWSIDEILKVRKEFLERPLKVGAGDDNMDLGKTANELSEAMDSNPDLAAMLLQFAEANSPQKTLTPAED